MIQIQNLVKHYGSYLAVDHLNLEVKEGEVFGLLGPNGSGKSTTIGCLLSLLKYDEGNVTIFGKPMNPDSYDIKREIGVVLQNVAVFEQMTVRENIDFFCGLYVPEKKKRKELVDAAIEFVGLENHTKKKPKELSGGLLRRLNIACGIAHQPKLIILDEPTVAVDPQSRNKILESIQELNRRGSTIIYTSHYMEEVEQICDRIAIIDHGQCIALGTSKELKRLLKVGETTTIEQIDMTEEQLKGILDIEYVLDYTYENRKLVIHLQGAKHNLPRIMHYLESLDIPMGRVYTELPTLNDVFLSLTGKELRE